MLNTNSGQVDLTQSPEDFMKLAKGETVPAKEVEPPAAKTEDVTPAKESAALDSKEQPKDNAEKAADELKPTEEKEVEKTTPKIEEKVEPDPKKLSAEEYQKREASKIIQRQGEERKRAMLAHVEAARKAPDHIHTLANIDRKLANEVIKEVWGYSDYDELLAQARIAEIKTDDPEKAELESRLFKLEREGKDAKEMAKKQVTDMYLKSKGIAANDLDPRYIMVQDKLKLLNPSFVEQSPTEALAEAYRMAFGEEGVNTAEVEKQEMINKTVTPAAAAGAIKDTPKVDTGYGDKTESFAALVGAKLK